MNMIVYKSPCFPFFSFIFLSQLAADNNNNNNVNNNNNNNGGGPQISHHSHLQHVHDIDNDTDSIDRRADDIGAADYHRRGDDDDDDDIVVHNHSVDGGDDHDRKKFVGLKYAYINTVISHFVLLCLKFFFFSKTKIQICCNKTTVAACIQSGSFH